MLKTVFSVPHSAFKHWPLGFLPPPIFLEISSPFFTSSLFILGDVLCLQNKATDFSFYSVISSPISSLTDGFFSLLLSPCEAQTHTSPFPSRVQFHQVSECHLYTILFLLLSHTPTTYIQRLTIFIFHKLHQYSVKSSPEVS